MQNYGSFIASNYLAPALSLQVPTGGGWQYMQIINNSPYLLNITFDGMGSFQMPEMFREDFLVTKDFRNAIVITPVVNITTVSHAVSNLIIINAWKPGEITAPQAVPLSQPAVSATATGKPVFTATYGNGGTTGIGQVLNVFNPHNSGVSFTFHSARIFSNDSTLPTANLFYQSGADRNFSVAVPAVSHSGSTTPPVSFAHCTADDLAVIITTNGSDIEVLDMSTSMTGDMLAFPDNTTLSPGGNLFIGLNSGTTGHIVRLTLKWEEDIATLPQGGVPPNVATSLVNIGNPAPTPIITATPGTDVGTAVLLMNTGVFTLGDAANPGTLAIINAGTTINSGGTGGSGTATMIQSLNGTVKEVWITLNAFKNGTAIVTVAFPKAFTILCLVECVDNNNFSLLVSSVAQNARLVTTWGGASAGADTGATITNIQTDSKGVCVGAIDSIQFAASSVNPHSGYIYLKGV